MGARTTEMEEPGGAAGLEEPGVATGPEVRGGAKEMMDHGGMRDHRNDQPWWSQGNEEQ